MMIGGYEVPGFRIGGAGFEGKCTATVETPTDDLSGNTDSTDKADKGVKPKKLNISFSLRYKEKSHLTALVELAEARDGGGEAIKYPIVSGLATILRIRTAQFSGQVSIDPDDTLHCWRITFSLSEFRSVPEAANARAAQRSGAAATGSFDDLVKRMESA